MIQQVMARLVGGVETKSRGVSADSMLDGMDKHLENFSTLVKPLPESKSRTPFDGPDGENLSPARNFTPRQLMKVMPQVLPMIYGMWRTSRMYDGKFTPQQNEASQEFIAELEAMALTAGAKDIRYIKVRAMQSSKTREFPTNMRYFSLWRWSRNRWILPLVLSVCTR